MKLVNLQQMSDEQFRRVTGLKRTTFEKMVELLQEAHTKKKARGGRPNKLTVAEMLLMALEYLREYRTYLHIATSYGISESNTFEAIRWVEDTLIQSKEFRLPGRKALLKSDNQIEIVLVDATETPIERPKKNSANTILEKRNVIP